MAQTVVFKAFARARRLGLQEDAGQVAPVGGPSLGLVLVGVFDLDAAPVGRLDEPIRPERRRDERWLVDGHPVPKHVAVVFLPLAQWAQDFIVHGFSFVAFAIASRARCSGVFMQSGSE